MDSRSRNMYWPDHTIGREQLLESTPNEEDQAKALITRHFSRVQIRGVQTINNDFLTFMYNIKKAELTSRHGHVNERMLVHVTAQANVRNIALNNFDWRRTFRGKFGKGVSFSEDAEYADFYANNRIGKRRALIITRVLVAHTTPGCYDQILPPPHSDTTVGNSFKVYVKYYDNEYLPLYVAYYECPPEINYGVAWGRRLQRRPGQTLAPPSQPGPLKDNEIPKPFGIVNTSPKPFPVISIPSHIPTQVFVPSRVSTPLGIRPTQVPTQVITPTQVRTQVTKPHQVPTRPSTQANKPPQVPTQVIKKPSQDSTQAVKPPRVTLNSFTIPYRVPSNVVIPSQIPSHLIMPPQFANQISRPPQDLIRIDMPVHVHDPASNGNSQSKLQRFLRHCRSVGKIILLGMLLVALVLLIYYYVN